jgi:hypothetical protein
LTVFDGGDRRLSALFWTDAPAPALSYRNRLVDRQAKQIRATFGDAGCLCYKSAPLAIPYALAISGIFPSGRYLHGTTDHQAEGVITAAITRIQGQW